MVPVLVQVGRCQFTRFGDSQGYNLQYPAVAYLSIMQRPLSRYWQIQRYKDPVITICYGCEMDNSHLRFLNFWLTCRINIFQRFFEIYFCFWLLLLVFWLFLIRYFIFDDIKQNIPFFFKTLDFRSCYIPTTKSNIKFFYLAKFKIFSTHWQVQKTYSGFDNYKSRKNGI